MNSSGNATATKLHLQIGRYILRAEKLHCQWRFKCSAFPHLEEKRAECANATIEEFERLKRRRGKQGASDDQSRPVLKLPKLLREVADQIEADQRRGKLL